MNQPASDADRPVSRLDALIHEYLQQIDEGKLPDREALLRQHPDLAEEMAGFFDDQDRIAQFARQLRLEDTVVLANAANEMQPVPTAAAVGGLPHSIRYFGRYEILQEIARGGMGVVYKARQSRLDRVVALKMILAGQLASTADVSRFYSEAQAAANLEHPGIVPIHEVGQYGGQHYFSMAYVDGESLAERLAAGPLPQQEAAVLVQQLCEAVQYAHQRGVIHRDLKPGNVLIDRDGRAHITDFGLAKQTAAGNDLTATGQVLGTPSYMPPEQAAGDLAAVGPAADIYSLGAVLYAALTGRPPFQAATPIDTLLQVRFTDPVSPRLLNPSVNKDLETICLKSLEKEPERRYASAGAMAEDLRRFLHDEPILARRLGPIARSVRWVRKRRRMVGMVAASAALAAILLIGGFLVWRARERSLLGNVAITTDGPSLVAEVLDEADHPAGPSFPVPNSQPVQLPEGSYRVRLSSAGIVSQDYSLQIDRGATVNFDARLEDRTLWPPLELKPDEYVEPVAFGRRTDLLVYRSSNASLRRIDGATGKPVWPSDLVLNKSNWPGSDWLRIFRSKSDRERAIDENEWSRLLVSSGNPWQSSWLAATNVGVQHGVDVDLIFASRTKPALVAVSGTTGKVLWHFRGRTKLIGVADPSGFEPIDTNTEVAPVIGRPVINVGQAFQPDGAAKTGSAGVAPDPRIVACFSSPGESFKGKDGRIVSSSDQTWLECISGKTGRSIWRYDVATTNTPAEQPWERLPRALEAIAQPQIVTIGGRKIVVSTIERTLHGVDLVTGKAAWPPVQWGFEPDARPAIVVPHDGGPPIAIYISGRPHNGQSTGGSYKLEMTGIALDWPHQVWQTAIEETGVNVNTLGSPTDSPECEIVPIGPHNEPAIIAPAWSAAANAGSRSMYNSAQQYGSTTLTIFDAATGKLLWQKSLNRPYPSFQTVRVRWTVGPDLDGDGYREIFATWVGDDAGTPSLTVAAFSGRDGATLWRWTQPGANFGENKQETPMSWWTPTEDGWPKLVVPVSRAPGGQAATYLFDSADGRLMETLPGVSDPRSADLDGNGLADLFYTVAPQGYSRLMAVRGTPPTAWRNLDSRPMQVAEDFDGDGIADAIADGGQPVAISGRDGRTLWHATDCVQNPRPISALLPIGKAGGLGPALLGAEPAFESASAVGYQSSGLEAAVFSGADGHRIWPVPGSSNGRIPYGGFASGSNGSRFYAYPALGVCTLDRARPDVLTAAPDASFAGSPTPLPPKVWLSLFAGDTGRFRWKAAVAFGLFGQNGQMFRDEFQDLNGDGVADIVAWAPPSDPQATAWQLKAFSATDGTPLWPGAPAIYGPMPQGWTAFLDLPAVGDLDGKGAPDVVFVRQQPYDPKAQGQPSEVVAVEGRTGRVKWTWRWVNSGEVIVPPLLVDFDGSGRHSVCLYVNDVAVAKQSVTYQQFIVILDGQGKLRRRVQFNGGSVISAAAQFWSGLSWWRKVAVGGDGKEALLVYDPGSGPAIGTPPARDGEATRLLNNGNALQAVGGKRLEPLWHWHVPDDLTTVPEVVPAGKTGPATIAVWCGKSIYGISAADGQTRWRGEMPTPPAINFGVPTEHVVLQDRNGPALPRLLTRDGCRLAWPVDAENRYQPSPGTPRQYAPLPELVPTRPLPWVRDNPMVEVLKMAVWSCLWLVVPTWLIRRSFRRRSWRLALVPALYQIATVWSLKIIPLDWFPLNVPLNFRASYPYVVVAVFSGIFLLVHIGWGWRRRLWAIVDASVFYAVAMAMAWSQQGEHHLYFGTNEPWWAFGLGGIVMPFSCGLSAVAAVALPVSWIYRRKWGRLGLFLVVSLVCAAIFAAVLINWDNTRFFGDEQYSLDGWYGVLAWGLLIAAMLTLLAWLLKITALAAVRLARRAFRLIRL